MPTKFSTSNTFSFIRKRSFLSLGRSQCKYILEESQMVALYQGRYGWHCSNCKQARSALSSEKLTKIIKSTKSLYAFYHQHGLSNFK